MKSRSLGFLLMVIFAIGLLSYIDIYGFTIGSFSYLPVTQSIRKGLDIAGGSIITYEAKANSVSSKDADTVVSILRQRLTSKGYTEANVSRSGEKKFIVEIPAVTNPEEAVKTLGATAQLKFVDPSGKEVLNGSDVEDAKVEFKQLKENSPAENIVALTLKESGVSKFAQATKELAGKPQGQNYIAIKLDDQIISQPSVKEEINSKDCIIQGNFTAESAKELADTIRAGQLPFGLQEAALSSVGATLGENALAASIKAAAIAMLLVILYIVLFYRLPGITAAIALVGYTALISFIYGLFKVNITLPGLAGIILSIGMAVDANVITFERIIDELKSGKTLLAAIDAGFHRALTAIIDSNVTTLIAAVVLMFFGTGTVAGFAITLFIGVLTSMFTAVVVTRFLLNQLVGLNVRHHWLYGIGVK